MAPSSGSANPSIPARVAAVDVSSENLLQKMKRREKQTNSISSIFPSFSSCFATTTTKCRRQHCKEKAPAAMQQLLTFCQISAYNAAFVLLCVSLAGRPLFFLFLLKNHPSTIFLSFSLRFVVEGHLVVELSLLLHRKGTSTTTSLEVCTNDAIYHTLAQ